MCASERAKLWSTLAGCMAAQMGTSERRWRERMKKAGGSPREFAGLYTAFRSTHG